MSGPGSLLWIRCARSEVLSVAEPCERQCSQILIRLTADAKFDLDELALIPLIDRRRVDEHLDGSQGKA